MKKEQLHLLQIIILGSVIQENDKNEELGGSEGLDLLSFSQYPLCLVQFFPQRQTIDIC